MQSHSPRAFLLSATLHGVIVALILFFGYLSQAPVKDAPKIFELVAGEGDNYMATEAPALGVPGGIKISIPEPPAPKPAAAEPAPTPIAPEPVITSAPLPKTTAPTKAAPDEIRDFKKDVQRIATKRQARLEAVDRKKREADERKAKEEELRNKRMTKEDFDRQNKAAATKAPAGAAAPKIARIDAEGIKGGVVGGSTANKVGGAGGKALTRDEGNALDLYFSLLKRRLKDALDKPPGLSDRLIAIAEVRIGADGTLSNARIKSSSGSSEFDHAVLEAIARVRSIGPRPDGKSEVLSIPFRMREEDDS